MSALKRIGMAVVLVAAWMSAPTLETTADEGAKSDVVDWSARAKEAWHKTCTKCHTVPDAQYETDRAFLRQVTETS